MIVHSARNTLGNGCLVHARCHPYRGPAMTPRSLAAFWADMLRAVVVEVRR